MTSKLGIKASKKERPKSSDKASNQKFARKLKDAGTPENKTQSPVGAIGNNGETSNTGSPIQNINEWDEEVKLLRINPENLKSSGKPPSAKSGYPTTKVLVKKKAAVCDKTPKESKRITVAYRAPSDAEVKLPNPEDFPGIRVSDTGGIVPHSILGTIEDFVEQAVKNGDESNASIKVIPKQTPSPWPEDDGFAETKKSSLETKQIRVDDTRALENWERQMNIRKNEQRYLSNAVNMPPDMLLMNQDEDFRRKHEERTLIDRAIPAMDYGKGYRVGSEFWKQVEVIGGEDGIQMTLTQTEKGFAPPIEHIGRPDTIKQSVGIDWNETRRLASIHYPWLKSQYLQERKEKLKNVIEEMNPHQPYLNGLEVIGRSLQNRNEQNNNISEKAESASELSDASHLEEEFSDPLADYEDVIPLPIFGPSLTINGHAAQWKSKKQENNTGTGLNIRLNFQEDAGSKSFNSINITNDGTSAVYYSWKKIPMKDPFGIKKIRPLHRFFFDIRNGVILPNSSINIPITFISPNAGIFLETWVLETQPILCGGEPISIILRGVATEEDMLAKERKELEEELQRRQQSTFVKELVEEILNGVRTPPRPSTPIDSYLTEEELFSRQNRKMTFNTEAVNDLKAFHTQIDPESDWDMSIDTLLQSIQHTEDEELKENLVQKLNEDVQVFSLSPDNPVQKTSYNLCYEMVCEAMDTFYVNAGKLRLSMGLPEKEFVVEIIQEEILKKPKKTQAPENQKSTPDKKLDPKKKDSRPISSRGKTSGNLKPKAKDIASASSASKQLNAETASNRAVPTAKWKVAKKEPKTPLEISCYKNLYVQMYDILCDVANKVESSL